jgi:hypothetical protein
VKGVDNITQAGEDILNYFSFSLFCLREKRMKNRREASISVKEQGADSKSAYRRHGHIYTHFKNTCDLQQLISRVPCVSMGK